MNLNELRSRACWAIVLAVLDALRSGKVTPDELREAARVGMEEAE